MDGRLIVNLGSRSLAWRGLGLEGRESHKGAPGRCFFDMVPLESWPREVILGSVATVSLTADLVSMLRRHGARVRELRSAQSVSGVRNAYTVPEQLGIDRWAALVAAYRQCGGPLVVADCGTAVTLDVVDGEGRHRGGGIAPGMGLMRDALAMGTRVDVESIQPEASGQLGCTTEMAVAYGIESAILGMIQRLVDQAEVSCGPISYRWLTGGEAPKLAARLEGNWRHAPQLVLDGLELLADSFE